MEQRGERSFLGLWGAPRAALRVEGRHPAGWSRAVAILGMRPGQGQRFGLCLIPWCFPWAWGGAGTQEVLSAVQCE